MPISKRQPLVFPVDEKVPAPLATTPETLRAPVGFGGVIAVDTATPPADGAPSAKAGGAISPRPDGATPAVAATPLTPLDMPGQESNQAPYWVAFAASLVWILGLGAFAIGFHADFGAPGRGPMGLMILMALTVAPLGFIWAAAFAVAQARALLGEVRRARRLTDEMIGPAALAAAGTGTVVHTVRAQIIDASEAAAAASERLATLHQALASQTEQLSRAASTADRTASKLVDRLSNQRGELMTLAVTLDARAASVTDAINRQARMVADASDLAETQLREAEASLAARAADLSAAAAEATDASRSAGDDLARQVGRLETAGLGVGDQLRSLEDGLTHQRAALITVAHALRADQEDFTSLAETRTAQLATFLTGAGRDVTALNEVTVKGAHAMSELVEAAAGRFRELADTARTERDLFGASAVTSLNTLSEIGANERRALEAQTRQTIQALSGAAAEAREAADAHAEAARARVEQLNEAAFVAGQRADKVFETRLDEARGLIAQSVKMVEEAGASTAGKLEEGVAQARSALEELRRMVEDVGADAARLPAETEARAVEVRAAVARGMEELLATARQTAEETQAIDASFQERVKRNYEMLSEAVQLMGVVARGGQGPEVPRLTGAKARPAPRAGGAHAGSEASTQSGGAAPGRPRLKLTPPPAEAVPEPSAPAREEWRPESEAPWSWKGLLTAVDSGPEGPAAELGREVAQDITGMGIDPAALLSKPRTEEIGAAVQTGDRAGAREVVRDLAPAAVRRLSRRLVADGQFRIRCQTWLRQYAQVIDEAVKRDPRGFEATSLLACEAGRAYLLLDAAVGEAS